MAEVVVVARYQMDSVIPLHQDFRDKIVPGGGPHLVVKGDHENLTDAIQAADQVLPVLRRVDEGAGNAGDHFFRHPVKGEYRGDGAPGGGHLHRAPQQGGVAQVDSVEEAQGDDFFLRGHIVYAPKKFLMDVRVPFSARERQRNSPF